MLQRIALLSLWLLVVSSQALAYSLRQFSSKNGLSNSAILSIVQTQDGLLWFGSCDGLNMFDGVNIKLYKPINSQNNLSGNLIEDIVTAENDRLWIQTNYGLDRFNCKSRTLQSFRSFKDKNQIAKDKYNGIYIVKQDNYIDYCKAGSNSFQKIRISGVLLENLLEICIDKNDILWIFSKNGHSKSYHIEYSQSIPLLKECNYFKHNESLLYAFAEEENVYFIDSTYSLYEYDLRKKKKFYIYDIEAEAKKRGNISSIIKHHDDFLIGFKSSGLIRVKYEATKKIKYNIEDLTIKSGIFCLMKDRYQDIVWVGTDGQGVYMYFTEQNTIKSTLFGNYNYSVNNPVRSLFLDKERTLWIGTKGDGILRIQHYSLLKEQQDDVKQLQTSNSELKDNSVYCFAPSRGKILWIGNENGLNYYSYPEKKIKSIHIEANKKEVKYIHAICELNDTTLWIATVGEGIIKAHFTYKGNHPVITSVKRIVIDGGTRSSNYFFTLYQENDSILWFGNRGYGAYKVNTHTDKTDSFLFDEIGNSQTLNDIFAIHKNKEGYWFGTSYGLTHLHNQQKQIFNESTGFPNNTIHSILEDKKGNLWLSTNLGIISLNIRENTVQTYRQQNELGVTEFSDGAYYKDEQTGTLFFGGTNGFVTIAPNDYILKEYSPKIQFKGLSIFGKEYNIYNFMANGNEVELNYDQNFFSVSFIAIDYINGKDYTYYYKIDGLSDNWVENGSSTRANFTNLSPGRYKLLVKYRNNITGQEGSVQSLNIRILPPWYFTNIAYLGYLIVIILCIISGVKMSIKRYRTKRNIMIEIMNRQKRDELYESKLRFFTNITHEFCTPLTLIYGPCEKIISYKKSDSYINKYASLIQHNAEKLNGLIQELIEFRRLETGHKNLEIKSISISDQVNEIIESFTELAESKKINYLWQIEKQQWNTDIKCLCKIVTNLLSNAFKYTPDEGWIQVEMYTMNEALKLIVTNSGKGIKQEDLHKIFDRYNILDNFEVQSRNGISARNGLGLAICHSMVNLLQGSINVTSIPNERTSFEVTLPLLEVSATEERFLEAPLPKIESPIKLQSAPTDHKRECATIMIIDDDPSMLWFVTDIFADKYNVISISDSREVMKQLKSQQVDLIISDVMMPEIDGISLTKAIKNNKLLSHIPLILLSAKIDTEEQVKGIESGAEVYITKPFNIKYLEKIVARLMQREVDLKEYYSSVYSAFKIDEGHFIHAEDKAFMQRILQIIDIHISNTELSVDFLSQELGYSTRQFYRKMKEITEKTPADIIKEYRLNVVERLLETTNLSIEEIMVKVGFINRGNFYKIFAQKHEITPKQYREQKKQKAKKLSEQITKGS